MITPPLALSWEMWWRHRWGFAAAAAVVAGFAVASGIESLSAQLVQALTIWFVFALCYVIGAFAYGSEARPEAPESGFPPRLFVLPVSTWLLVALPMIQGMIAALLLWLGWERLVLRPSGLEIPAWRTAMIPAIVGVCQALVWLPFGVPWLRIGTIITTLIALIRPTFVLELVGVGFATPAEEEQFLVKIAAGLIPLSMLIALFGVSRARHGGSPDWSRYSISSAFPRQIFRARLDRQLRPFSSPLQAQVWYEWRMRGRGFVVLVGCMLAPLMLLAFILQRQIGWHITDNMVLLMIPLVLAPFWSSYAGFMGESIRPTTLTLFAATRPMTNTAMFAAKIRAIGLAALAAWVFVYTVVLSWLLYTGGYGELNQFWERYSIHYGEGRVVAAAVLAVFGSILITWRILIVGAWAGMTGRVWVVTAAGMFFMLLSFQVLYAMALWPDLDRREWVLAVLPWLAGIAISVKLLIAGRSLFALHQKHEVSRPTAVRLAGTWLVVVIVLSSILIWLVPREMMSPFGIVMLVILLMPFARLAAAPLALAWNRHR